jgi:hypothetical protein
MAFVRFDAATDTSALVVADANGGKERVLATRRRPRVFISFYQSTATARPAWSPDGRIIAVFGFDGRALPRTDLVFVDVASGGEVTRDSQGVFVPQGLAWMGSTSLILNQPKRAGGPAQLWRMSYPDGAVLPMTNDVLNYLGAFVAADRASVVASRADTRVGIWVGDRLAEQGREVVTPFSHSFPFHVMRWAGQRLVYDSTVNGVYTISSVIPGAGAPIEVAPGFGPGATSDGKTVVFFNSPGSALWTIDTTRAAQPVQLVPDGLFPIVTRDDQRVIFLSTRSGVQNTMDRFN